MPKAIAAVLGLVLLGATIVVPVGIAQAQTRFSGSAPSMYLVMDVSGSMRGEPLDMAKAAARQFMEQLSPDQDFSLLTYPGGTKELDGCLAGDYAIGSAQTDPGQRNAIVNGLDAHGETPTGPALQRTIETFEFSGAPRGVVVLLSDGEANCGDTDICSIAQVMAQKGLQLQINTVSFNNTEAGNAELACVAQATGGEAVTVENVDGLIDAMASLSSNSLDLTVAAPDEMPVATGAGGKPSTLKVTVEATGSIDARNVKVVTTFSSRSGTPNVVRLTNPVIRLGNLVRGQRETVAVEVRPTGAQTGLVDWTVGLWIDNVPVEQETGEVFISATDNISAAGEILREAENVVVMGDSYSSGEGGRLGNFGVAYEHANDPSSKAYKCHRSKATYAAWLYDEAKIIACSGAETKHFNWANGVRGDQVEAQLLELRNQIRNGGAPDLVFLTIGGNDVGFGAIMSGCYLSPGCFIAWSDGLLKPNWNALALNLGQVYREVNSVANAPDALAQRGGKIAQIVVLPYVSMLPAGVNARSACFGGISETELHMLNTFQKELNGTVADVVKQMQDKDRLPIHYAASVEGAFRPSNTVCDGSDSFGVRGNAVDAAIIKSAAPDDFQELLHPNSDGYIAIASALVEWSLGVEPIEWEANGNPVAWKPPERSLWHRALLFLGLNRVAHIEPGYPVSSVCAGAEGEPCTSFKPETPIRVMLHSVPQLLGTVQFDRSGEMQGDIRLPTWTAAGDHMVILEGISDNGQKMTVETPVYVWRTGSGVAFLLIMGGTLVLCASGLMAFILRQKPRSSDRAV